MTEVKEDKSMLPFDVLQNKIRALMEKEKQIKEGDQEEEEEDGEKEEDKVEQSDDDDEARSGEASDEIEDEDEDNQESGQDDDDDDENSAAEEEEQEGGEENQDGEDGEEEEDIGMFGVELTKLMELQGDDNGDVPLILIVLIEKVIALRGLKTEGIFRVNGNLADVEKLATEGFDPEDEQCKIYSVFTWASLLKKWIRELPNRLVPESLYEPFIQAKSPEDINDNVLRAIERDADSSLENKLQKDVLNTVGLFFGQLLSDRNIVHTKMTLESVSIILTPTLFKPRVQVSLENITAVMDQQKRELESVKHLLMYYKQLYSQQQRQIQFDILQQKQLQLQQSPKPKHKNKRNRYNRKR